MTITAETFAWAAAEHNRIALAVQERLASAPADDIVERGREQHEALTDALAMLGVERQVASDMIGEYVVAHGDRAEPFASGVQLGLLLARREVAESV